MKLVNMGRFGLLPLALTVAACSDMDPARDTYRTVYGLGAAGTDNEPGGGGSAGSGGAAGTENEPVGDLPAPWQCLNTDLPPLGLPSPLPTTVNYLVPIVDFDNAPQTVPGLQVQLCTSNSCEPSIPIPAPVQPDPSRPLFLLVLPFGLQNPYLKLSAPNYATMDYYFGGPMVGVPNADPDMNPATPTPMFVGNVIPMLLQETLDGLLRDVQAPSPAEQGRGVLAVRTLNCAGARAPGVFVESTQEMPERAVPWTLSDNNVAVGGVLPTDSRGVAGFANVPEGAFRVEGIVPIGDGEIRYGAHTLRVKPGVITLGEVRRGIGQFGI